VLSDHEQRALEELERGYALEAREPVPSGVGPRPAVGRAGRPPGFLVASVLGCVSVVLLLSGVAAAALAVATATAIGWVFWRVCSHRADGGASPASLLLGAGHGRSRPGPRPGESIGQCLRWLSEAE
jgi:hypothetical protein